MLLCVLLWVLLWCCGRCYESCGCWAGATAAACPPKQPLPSSKVGEPKLQLSLPASRDCLSALLACLQKVGVELWKQTKLSLTLLVVFLLLSCLVRGRAPWTP